MSSTLNRTARTAVAVLLVISLSAVAQAAPGPQKKKGGPKPSGTPMLWTDPGDVAARDLYHGPTSPENAPAPPFTFVEEDKSGESPKFEVRDSRGTRWSVKLGPEAQAETVATRLVWAVGYFAEESYYLDEARVRRLPKLSRGREFVTGDRVRGARFEPKRADVVRGPSWGWNKNPFEDTRELSGLKILMILLNNYDAREANNRVLYVDGHDGRTEARFVVSDLGATLGRAGGLGGKRAKNDLEAFLSTKFVRGVDERDGVVEFDYDTRPRGLGHLSVLQPFYYRAEVKKEKAMRGIPVEHAAWIGSYLSRLTDEQLSEAFRAANYDGATAEGYVRALRERIDQLARLQGAPAVAQGSPVAAEGAALAADFQADDAPALTAFEGSVKEYSRLRERLEEKLPKLPKDATARQIDAHKAAFQRIVRDARAGARRGDIFTPVASAAVRRILKTELDGADKRELREKVFEAETQGVVMRVNHPYPETQELVDVPPTLLLKLPQLPKQVKYRFVGRSLLLVDRENGLIIDFMPDALP